MNEITLIGLDLAKNIFRVNAVNKHGKRIMNKNIHRGSMVTFFANLPSCVVAMEACSSCHYWARTIESLGHEVKIVHPRYVTPYRMGDKNDANDAAAICSAASRPDMRFVRMKSQNQSDMQAIHRVRDGLVKEKITTINRIRGLLAENGITIKQGPTWVFALVPAIVSDENNELSGIMRNLLRVQHEHLVHLRAQIKELEVTLKTLAAQDEACKRLMQIPGVGLLTATLLSSEVGNGSAFHSSRAFAAYLGLVPRQYSSGGKSRLCGIGKTGNRQLRTLLIHCARSVQRSVNQGKAPFGGGPLEQWVKDLMDRRGKNKTTVALAAKLARISWKILARETSFNKEFFVAQAA